MAILALAYLFAYGRLLLNQKLLGRDDNLLLDPIYAIKSALEFWSYLFSYRNPDLQPVRDISFLLDCIFEKTIHFRVFHITNLIIWLGSLFLVSRIWQKISNLNKMTWPMALLFGLHPIFMMSVGWISARKHLLALFFFLFALNEFLAWKNSLSARGGVKIIIAYVLCVLSQPILVFWPIWCICFEIVKYRRIRKNALLVLASLTGAMVLLVFGNYEHYSHVYSSGSEKLHSIGFFSSNPLSDILLALGRYFWNIFVPWQYSVTYARESLENLWGIPIFAIAVYIFWKGLGIVQTLNWLMLAALSLVLVLTKIPDLFVSDTYALTLVFCIGTLAVLLLDKFQLARRQKIFLPGGIILLVLFTLRSHAMSYQWESDRQQWESAFKHEADCFSSMNYAVEAFRANDLNEAMPALHYHMANKCADRVSDDLFSLGVFYDKNLKDLERIEILSKRPATDRLSGLITLVLLAELGSTQEAWEKLQAIYAVDPQIFSNLADVQRYPIAAGILGICSQHEAMPACKDAKRELSAYVRKTPQYH